MKASLQRLLESLRSYIREHGSRLSRFALLILLLAIGGLFFDVMPRETQIRVRLGSSHHLVEELRLSFREGDEVEPGEEVANIWLPFQGGAPETVDQTIDLSPGRYQVLLSTQSRGEDRRAVRTLEVPADGVVVLSF